jgi:SAM-dependent methyltransferase
MRNGARCESCGSDRIRAFYEVRGIPVHSCLLMSSREEATSYPRRDLRLGFCESCGFIQNTLFDPAVHEYSARYEETQAFSPTFMQFARGLAEQLIERYDLRNKTVLEIGCGKGEFLILLCEMGDNTGIGFDPGCHLERIQSEAAPRISIVRDFYSEKYAHVQADFVCCRHTLEHIHDTREFLMTVRRSIGERTDTIVFFEVPDVARVLEEQAFWDIYYEHCSYFSLGSLARLFRTCGFDVLDLWTAFDEQYLMIEAVPSEESSEGTFPAEDDMARLAGGVERLERGAGTTLARWREKLGGIRERGERAVLWGSSSKAVAFLTTLGVSDELEYVVDINPYRQGKHMPGTGHEIVPPDFLRDYRPDLAIAMNPIYCDEIRRDLAKMDLATEVIPVTEVPAT